jgi:hypothetical protein
MNLAFKGRLEGTKEQQRAFLLSQLAVRILAQRRAAAAKEQAQ